MERVMHRVETVQGVQETSVAGISWAAVLAEPDQSAPDGHMKSRKTKWSEEELKQLAEIVAGGGTPLRAAAKLNRNMTSCRIQARALGTPFIPLRVRRKTLLRKCAAAEKPPVR